MCGVIGVMDSDPVAEPIYQSLIQLQHRGQDAAGMFTYDPVSKESVLHKSRGLVSQVFNYKTLPLPEATWGIGHVRYQTVGTGALEDTQPLVIGQGPKLAVAYNGNIVNYHALRRELENEGHQFHTDADTEVLLLLLHKHIGEGAFSFENLCSAVREIYRRVVGAYSVAALLTGYGLFAFRDPSGIRPLLMGTRKNSAAVAFASESYALTFMNFGSHENLPPGEVFFMSKEFKAKRRKVHEAKPSYCSFEFDYFAKPNTFIEGREVYRVRSDLGHALACEVKKKRWPIDVVVSVPNTARPAGISLARELGVPYEDGFVKQEYIGRTFIMPNQKVREKAVSRKLAPVLSVFEGKNVLILDDSIVRGTVSKKVVALARRAKAKSVYFASTFPPIRFPCVYGIDFASQEQLIAHGRDEEEIALQIGADGLVYNRVDTFRKVIGVKGLCMACLTGEYPTATDSAEEMMQRREQDLIQIGSSHE